MNARLDGDDLVEEQAVHLGMAVALDDGLVVPVIRHANDLPLAELAAAARTLAAAARAGSLGPDDYAGGTCSGLQPGSRGRGPRHASTRPTSACAAWAVCATASPGPTTARPP